MAFSDAIRELLFRMYYINEMGISTIQPTVIFTDKWRLHWQMDRAIFVKQNTSTFAYHFIRDHLQRGTLEIIYIPSEKPLADFLTKALPTAKHNACLHGLRLD
jgi:hypothetical protein